MGEQQLVASPFALVPRGGSAPTTIASLIEQHKAEALRLGLRTATRDNHKYGYDSLLCLGTTVEDIGRESVSRAMTRWRASGMSDNQINRRIGGMKAVTKWAASFKMNLIESDPLPELTKIKERAKPMLRRFTMDEARAILKAAERSRWHLPFLIYFETGIRKMGLMLRTWDDFDAEKGLIYVRMGEGNKVNHEDALPAGTGVRERLVERRKPLGPLFPSPKGRFHGKRDPHRALQKYCDIAGVPRGGVHAMRRFCATAIFRIAGSGIASLALGHVDGRKTLAESRYIEPSVEDGRAAVEALEAELIGGQNEHFPE